MCFGCSVTTPGSRATYTHAHTQTRGRARSRRSFAITYHYSAWLLELQPRAMFATRLPCAILFLLPPPHTLSLSFSLFLAFASLLLPRLFLYHARLFLAVLYRPRDSSSPSPFSTLFLRVLPFHLALILRFSTLAICNYSPQSAEAALRLALPRNTFLTY